jgi:hypothetical protein
MSGRGGDVGGAGEGVQTDHQVAQRGHDLGAVAGADLGEILGERYVTHPVQAVLDLPVPADPGGQLLGTGLVWSKVGDRVDGLGAPAALPAGVGAERSGLTGDLHGLAGVRERDPGGDGDHL